MQTDTADLDIAAALDAIDAAVVADRQAIAAKEMLQQARVDLLLGRDAKAVFFASVAMRLQLVPDPSIDTAATDGRRILYNPAFVVGLTREQVVGLMAHEVMHVTNAHHARMGERDPQLWNVACDLAINPLLRDAAVQLPAGALFPGEGKYAALAAAQAAEDYYAALRQQQQAGGGGAAGTGDPGGCGGVRQPGDGSDAERRKAEAEARQAAAAAQQAVAASGRGDLPAGIGRQVRELLEPKADWLSILREFLRSHARNDYSWQRPNRRHVHAGLYLPGMHSEQLGRVVLSVDQSGSIDDATLARFAAEVRGVLEAYDCELTILHHDTHVQAVQEWKSTDGPIELTAIGGGGTSHRDVFAYVEREQLDPACVVCLTDLYTDFPDSDPGVPTLWCVTGNANPAAPFGRVVSID